MAPNELTTWADWLVNVGGAIIIALLLVFLPACAARYQPPGEDLWKIPLPEDIRPQPQEPVQTGAILRMLRAEDSHVRT